MGAVPVVKAYTLDRGVIDELPVVEAFELICNGGGSNIERSDYRSVCNTRSFKPVYLYIGKELTPVIRALPGEID